jgi:hypothetical protein
MTYTKSYIFESLTEPGISLNENAEASILGKQADAVQVEGVV